MNAAPPHPVAPTLRSRGSGPVDPAAPTTLRPLPLTATTLRDGFLARLQAENAATSIPHGNHHLESEGAWTNFEHAARREVGAPYHGPHFEDGEAFKWLEAVAWAQGLVRRDDFEEWLTRYSAAAADAQADDGYLSTYNQAAGVRGRYEWISYDHEIFNMATLVQAGVARYRATGREDLLDVARRAADHLDATFGWGKREEVCGHPLVEMALVELYRITQEHRYLDLAAYFVDRRGHRTLTDPTWQDWSSTYFSDRVPVREADHLEGHAVRAVYFAAGATDVAVETGDTELLAATRRLWDAMVEAKMYVNGSLGARWEGESFGDPYELPTDRGYGETCAAIACMQWSWRLLLATGEAKYADLIERQLYSAVLSGVSLDGRKYFYVNSLQVREGAVAYDTRMPASGRHEWFGCSCCPTNLMRTLATVHQYLATTSADGVQLHQLAGADIEVDRPDGPARLAVRTGYPWTGEVEVRIDQTPRRTVGARRTRPELGGGRSPGGRRRERPGPARHLCTGHPSVAAGRSAGAAPADGPPPGLRTPPGGRGARSRGRRARSGPLCRRAGRPGPRHQGGRPATAVERHRRRAARGAAGPCAAPVGAVGADQRTGRGRHHRAG